MKNKIISNQKNNFYKLVNELFLKIEDNLNLYIDKIDFDYEIQDYMITITFSNKSVIIINKQEFLQQIWLATKLNAYHFNYHVNKWVCNRSNKSFWEIFQKSFSMQSNTSLKFDNI
ncbi:iron donor protein CyaY [Buchnera aphidicola (Aphis craccivora)]|uniref:Iron-sulfur cluster assembly protein CyaY n=1 Tax=Buchnera aphidicola (Aphis craccivora) TaxID=466616 RepID=A0A4D6XNY5_9GAMM|nr:iron donor protein CyaY [Buchnera aphidicola]QCI16804.1 iron donor protein CyaY [Buchnera aphidicola (Aphis craccivora)]QLL40936.1 iron donor protein CyaY [Buchnera aphidicola (Aphis craccivore)]WAI17777.1 MAG: iron donor protein CyaY [Buchnera aphidicola (Aphis craccivora)]